MFLVLLSDQSRTHSTDQIWNVPARHWSPYLLTTENMKNGRKSEGVPSTFYISRPSKRRMIIQYRWCAAYWIFPPALLCYLWRPGQLHVFYSVPWHHAMISVSLCWRKESSNTWSSDESTLPCSVYSFHLLENKMATITTFICWFWSDPFALHVIKAGIFK